MRAITRNGAPHHGAACFRGGAGPVVLAAAALASRAAPSGRSTPPVTSTYLTDTLTASMAKLELRDLVSWCGFVTIAAVPTAAPARRIAGSLRGRADESEE